jgi:hypothetical protein
MMKEEAGTEQVDLDPRLVPKELRDMVPLAEQFGTGNEIAGPTAMRMMPESFTRDLRDLVERRRDRIQSWLDDDAKWQDEKLAFASLIEWADFSRPISDAAPPDVDPAVLKRMVEELEQKLKTRNRKQ